MKRISIHNRNYKVRPEVLEYIQSLQKEQADVAKRYKNCKSRYTKEVQINESLQIELAEVKKWNEKADTLLRLWYNFGIERAKEVGDILLNATKQRIIGYESTKENEG